MIRYTRGLKQSETLVKIPIYELGLGHVTRPDPNRLRPGQSVRTYDVNLDRPVSVAQRGGIRSLCENPAGAVQIATCEEAGWTAGAGKSVDTVIFRPYKASILGTSAIRLTVADPGGGTNWGSKLVFASPIDLGSELEEYICFWLYINDKSKLINPGFSSLFSPRISIETTEDVDNFGYGPPIATLTDSVTDGKPWNFIVARKDSFFVAGNPDWSNINLIKVKTCGKPSTPGGTFVVFDNIFLAPKQVDGLHEFRQSSRRGGGAFKLAAARGTVAYLDEQLHRWVPLITGRTPYVPVSFQTMGDFCYVANEGGDKVKVILGDGDGNLSAGTCYDAGIALPTGSPAFTEKPGGELPVGIHEYRFRGFSTITGLPGNSVSYSTAPTAVDAVIHIEPIPSSSDPKVTHIDIFRRDATESYFKRVARLPLGQGSYNDAAGTLSLGDILDGRPQYVSNSPPPPLSIIAKIGTRMAGAGDPNEPAVAYFSRPNNGEQWDLARAPVRFSSNRYDAICAIFEAFGHACVSLGDPLHVGTPESGPTGFRFIQRAEVGAPISHRSVVALTDAVLYRGRDGYYQFNRSFRPQKISRDWDIGPPAPGVVEPTFAMLDNRDLQRVVGAYVKDRAQILWTDKMSNTPVRNLVAVYHVGQVEAVTSRSAMRGSGGSVSGWAFHRYANGNALAGANCLAEYLDNQDGMRKVMMAGPGGMVYQTDTDEIDDVMANERVVVNGHVIFPFAGQPGVAMGQHQLKDYVYHDIVFAPITVTPVKLEYFYDWKYLATADTKTPLSTDAWAAAALPFQAGPMYAQLGDYQRVDLGAGRHRNVAWSIRNETLGGTFIISECTWWIEYLGGEGAIQ